MNSFLNFRLRSSQVLLNPTILFLLILFALLTVRSGFAQAPPQQPCQEETPSFSGLPELTLCQRYPNFNCEIQIGTGTLFPKSSMLSSATLSGNVCVVGNFEVDVPLTFQNALVKINPGVTIAITPSPNGSDAGSWLAIDNSKLFACNGLWKGITLGQMSSIGSRNNSVIEDAETAIFASAFSALFISQTTFNRNRVGIELFTPFPNLWVPGPVLWEFTGNLFTCTAPLNGTTNEITSIGVKLRDSGLYPMTTNNNNTFRGIINGIVAESSNSNAFAVCNVFADNYHFEGIRDKGIDFEGRSLDVRNSTFEHIGKHGIYFHESSLLNLAGNEFFIRELTTPMSYRYMVQIDAPKIDNNLHISNNYFYTEGRLFNWLIYAIQLTSSSSSFDPIVTFKAVINWNTFDMFNASLVIPGHPSRAISIEGNLATDSDIDIEGNDFAINPFILNDNRGIVAYYGSKHNIHVIGNHFTGGGKHIDFWGSPNGGANVISANTLDPSSDFNIGMFLEDFPQTTICSNTNNGASNVGYLMRGKNLGTVFSGNHTYGCWQHTFWITGDEPVIGQQIHNGNEWGPAIVANNGSNFFVTPFLQHNDPTPDIIDMSKFLIHTPQSVWNGNQYTFFSPFHPATQEIVPDFNDEFFEQDPGGTPTVNCLTQLQSPDEVDLLIANGGFAGRISNVGSVFDAKRLLYRKLQENPGYRSSHVSFGAFLSAEQHTSVGKFYLLEKTIDDAHKLSSTAKTALGNAKEQRDAIVGAMGQQGMNQTQLLAKIIELLSVDEDAQEVLEQQEANKSGLLNNALTIWQSITPLNVFEQYRKDVLGIYLASQTQQGGLLTEGQEEDLQGIAILCSEAGGSAVYLAQGLLPECARAEIMAIIEQCHEIPDADPRENRDTRHILISEDAQVQVSPNPAKDWINIVSVRQMEGHAEVYALTGQLVASRNIAFGDNPILFDLNSGVYVLRIIYENGENSSHKLVINK